MRSFPAVATLLWAQLVCTAQGPGLNGPVSGLVFDEPSQAIRLVHGIPGAAYLGPPVLEGVNRSFVAPDGQAAVVRSDETWYLITQLRSEDRSWGRLEVPPSEPVLLTWSSGSKAVAYMDSDARQIRILKREDASSSTVDARDLPGPVVALAVDNAGGTVYAAAYGEEGGGVYRARAGDAMMLLTSTRGSSALALTDDGEGLYVLDLETGALVEFQKPAQPASLPAPLDLAAGPAETASALGVTRDGRRLLIARGGSEPRIDVYDVAGRAFLDPVELDVAADGISPLAGGPHFLLNRRSGSGEPLTILTGGSPRMRAFFVPAGE